MGRVEASWRRLGRDSQVHCCPQDPDTLLIWLLDELVLLHFPWVALRGVPGHASTCTPASGAELTGCTLRGTITTGRSLPFRRKLDVIAGICPTKMFRIWAKLLYRLYIGKLLLLSRKCGHLLGKALAVRLPSWNPAKWPRSKDPHIQLRL